MQGPRRVGEKIPETSGWGSPSGGGGTSSGPGPGLGVSSGSAAHRLGNGGQALHLSELWFSPPETTWQRPLLLGGLSSATSGHSRGWLAFSNVTIVSRAECRGDGSAFSPTSVTGHPPRTRPSGAVAVTFAIAGHLSPPSLLPSCSSCSPALCLWPGRPLGPCQPVLGHPGAPSCEAWVPGDPVPPPPGLWR